MEVAVQQPLAECTSKDKLRGFQNTQESFYLLWTAMMKDSPNHRHKITYFIICLWSHSQLNIEELSAHLNVMCLKYVSKVQSTIIMC